MDKAAPIMLLAIGVNPFHPPHRRDIFRTLAGMTPSPHISGCKPLAAVADLPIQQNIGCRSSQGVVGIHSFGCE